MHRLARGVREALHPRRGPRLGGTASGPASVPPCRRPPLCEVGPPTERALSVVAPGRVVVASRERLVLGPTEDCGPVVDALPVSSGRGIVTQAGGGDASNAQGFVMVMVAPRGPQSCVVSDIRVHWPATARRNAAKLGDRGRGPLEILARGDGHLADARIGVWPHLGADAATAGIGQIALGVGEVPSGK